MSKVMRSRWLPALTMAIFGLLVEPGVARADKRIDDLSIEADSARSKAADLAQRERYIEAIPLAEQEVATREKIVTLLKGRLPKQHTADEASHEELLARALDHLARALIEAGDYTRPEALLARAAALHNKVLPKENHFMRGFNLRETGRLAAIKGDFASAERALKEVTDHGNPHDGGVVEYGAAFAFSELGRLYTTKGDYARAEPLLKTARDAVARKSSIVLTNLAELYLEKAELEAAEPELTRALKDASFWADIHGAPSPTLARTLDDLGELYLARAVPARAEEAFSRALEIQEKALGPDHPAVAVSLDGLGQALLRRLEVARAEASLTRALAIVEKSLGPDHLETARVRLHLGDHRRASGDRRAADELYQRALAAREKALGPDHAAVAEATLRRAEIRFADGDNAVAESLCQRAISTYERALGAGHIRVADALDVLATIHLATGKLPLARGALERSAGIRDRVAVARLAAGTDDQKLAAMEAMRGQTDLILSLSAASAPPDPASAALGLATILRRKGRALDALAEGRAALRDRQSQENKTLLDQLVSIQARIVDLIVRGPGIEPIEKHRAAIAELEKQKQRLEAEVSKQSAKIIVDDRLVTLDDVRQAIPGDAALVEMFIYQPWTPGKEKRNPRVLAYVARRSGPVGQVDLGEASALKAMIGPLRQALSDPTKDPARLSRALDEQVMRKVRALVGDARRILISPDGELNLVPFGALIDEDGRYLLERWSFTYLSSGRDLVRYTYDETPPTPGIPAVVIGAPDFGDPEKKRSRYRSEEKVRVRRSIDMSDIRFPSLPETSTEASSIGAAIPGAKVILGAEATEEAVKTVEHPKILHLATHGFFLPDQVVLSVASGSRGAPQATTLENPLLRSGVVLASANHPVPGREDGILTAMEASGLDLYGTRLVVLSACETGVGEAKNGDGVYGLRRALVVAGAQTLVMSLWKISDEETRDLMVAYYGRLQKGGGRSEAMREVALEMRASPGHAHPYYWASFIVSGDGSTLDGKDVPPGASRFLRVRPGAKGCGCAVVGEERGGGGALFGVALLMLAVRRRSA